MIKLATDTQKQANDFADRFIKSIKDLQDQINAEYKKENQDHQKIDELTDELTDNYGVDIVSHIEIILGGGGPAMKIVWYYNDDHAEIHYQDWFTAWTPATLTNEQQELLNNYCSTYFDAELFTDHIL
tara:strand:+ start:541 stop:924 length:384 start_codon:yes stop_codon:yes gene_type:complete